MYDTQATERFVAKAEAKATQAHGIFIQSLAEQWRELANSKVRSLVVDKQPIVTEGLGDRLSEFRHELAGVIDSGADRVPDLFSSRTTPTQMLKRNITRALKVELEYVSPVAELAKPLHNLLQTWGYNPELIKTGSPRASYSYDSFTESDLPLPGWEVRRAYEAALSELALAQDRLAKVRLEAASARVASVWDEG